MFDHPERVARTASGVLVLLCFLLPGSVSAQGPTARATFPGADAAVTADDLHFRMQPREALDTLEAGLERYPAAFELQWRAAREAVHLGMLTQDRDRAREWYAKAEGHARKALDSAPDRWEGHLWLAVALGRQALGEGPRERVRLAETIREEARTALAIDSTVAGAHHVLGSWHSEIMQIGGVSRFVARRLVGGDVLDEASWEAAIDHLSRAVALEPLNLHHHLALAEVYLARERPGEARRHLRDVLDLPAREPVDPLFKQRAQELLREID